MKDRFKLLRKTLNLTQTGMGEKLGVSRDVITNIEQGRVEAKPIFITHLCELYGVSQTWLETGEGDMFEPQTQDEELAQLFGDLLGDPDDTFKKRFISALLQLDSGEWGKIEQFCRTVIDSRDEKKEDR